MKPKIKIPVKLPSAQMKTKQMKKKSEKIVDGNFKQVVSTGSTLLDLAISGGVIRGGGLPGGILVEIFGPSGCGKTVLLSEIAGAIQRAGGENMFHDPEARINKQFAAIFDVDFDKLAYTQPDTVTEVFKQVRAWKPSNPDVMNGCMTDSLAALSTNMEMDNEEGDKMGMRRAKEFSEQLRKTARVLAQKNWLMVCSNQVRTNTDAGMFGEKHTTPGGVAVGFYSSVRLRCMRPIKIKNEVSIAGKKQKRIIGIETTIQVYKSSVDKPYREAPVIILFDYGIDDIRANLQYLKTNTKATTYMIGDRKLAQSLDESIAIVEDEGLEHELKKTVIDLWEEIEAKFETDRKKKKR